MLDKQQIKLVQTAVRAAGIRSKRFEGRYRLLLGQYRTGSGAPVRTCKDLTNSQLDDLLAICESLGWRHPDKEADHYRKKVNETALTRYASYAQKEAIKHLAGDLGWNEVRLKGMIRRMTNGAVESVTELKRNPAFKIIEALKAILSRQTGKSYSNLNQIREEMEAVTDGKEQKTKIG